MKNLIIVLVSVLLAGSISYASCSMSTESITKCALSNGDTIELTNRPECGYDKYLVNGTSELAFNGVVENSKTKVSTYRFGSIRVLVSFEALSALQNGSTAFGGDDKSLVRNATVVKVVKGTKKLESVGVATCKSVVQ